MSISSHNDKFELIFDNAGGATFQLKDKSYVHHYRDDMNQLATDVVEFQKSGNTTGWDGNEPEFYISDDHIDANPHGYDLIDMDNVSNLLDGSGFNEAAFAKAYLSFGSEAQ